MKYPSEIENLPITPFLDEICEKLKSSPSRFLVLTAETAAGKSTALPIALLKHFSGKMLMLEPRRIATVAIASRVSDLLREKVGETVGYSLHLESKKSPKTRFEIVTEAILTRKLQANPLLDDIHVIVLDEFHERSIHADLALALLKETMQLREDLFVIVMSATIDFTKLSEYLNAPVMKIPGRQFPVQIEYVEQDIGEAIVSIVSSDKQTIVFPQSMHNSVDNFRTDTILAFLPGIYELTNAKSKLEEKLNPNEFEILLLHSSISLSEQKKILEPVPKNSKRRIILSSAIAETSLTVPGVTIVVDSGLCRMNVISLAVGMERLVTEKESLFSADQRSGRAGRIMSGKAYRLWNKNDVRLETTPPEILRTDLTPLVLECAKWGNLRLEKFDWLTPPTENAWNYATHLLAILGCIQNSKITEKGENVLKLGLSPRLACVALCGESAIPTVLRFSEFKNASPQRQQAFCDDLKRRLKNCAASKNSEETAYSSSMEFLLAGYPDRIARKLESSKNTTVYQFPSGRKAALRAINNSEWIVAPEVSAGEIVGTIYSYENIPSDFAEKWVNDRSEVKITTIFTDEKSFKMQKSEITCYGKIILKEKKLIPTCEDFSSALCESIKRKGLDSLPIDSKTEDLLLRAEFKAKHKNDSVLENKLKNLQNTADEWLKPFLTGTKITAETVFESLRWYFEASDIDNEVPRELTLPNGKKRKVFYERHDDTIRPVMKIIIQQIFGCFETPKILGVPILLNLLSPAQRPLQITDDLEHFWSGAWIEICKEMKGRYPKHNWDYRIAETD